MTSLNEKRSIVVIGGGPAGMAAAVAAVDAGAEDVLVLERDVELGGILNQCVHNGFGLHRFKEELTGPEYAARYEELVGERPIEVRLGSTVVDLTNDRRLTVLSRERGLETIDADAVVLAMGCRERPRGALNIAGTRPAGVFSAGTAQRLVNREGLMPGKRVVVLGSGDIGLIMARRMTLEGAEVLCVAELMPFSSGLRRNIVQCLDDFDIPLLLSHTAVEVLGKERVEGVVIAEVDEHGKPIPGTEVTYDCDTLLLSCGLIPENELTRQAQIPLAPVTSGAVVDDQLMCEAPGIFACGNVLHVHDLVDHVSEEAARAGACAARYVAAGGEAVAGERVAVQPGDGVRYVVPAWLHPAGDEPVTLRFRVAEKREDVRTTVRVGDQVVASKRRRVVGPGEMEEIVLKPEALASLTGDVTVSLEPVAPRKEVVDGH